MSEPLDNEFINTVNRHGYAFQFAVLERAKQLHASGESQFQFVVIAWGRSFCSPDSFTHSTSCGGISVRRAKGHRSEVVLRSVLASPVRAATVPKSGDWRSSRQPHPLEIL